MTIDLSILIPSIHTRYQTFGRAIQDQVWQQLASLPEDQQQRIEVLMLTDNKQMLLGAKRNQLIAMAQGRYVLFVDDDDRIEPDLFASLLRAIDIEPNVDVITFLVSVSLNGGAPKICEYSLHFTEDRNFEDRYERLPNHVCAVKSTLARRVKFPKVVFGEDSVWAKKLRPLLVSEHHIHRVLYHYDWSVDTTETRDCEPVPLSRDTTPQVDIVIVSDGQNRRLQEMTQATINSCLAGAKSLPVRVVVMEQQTGVRYKHAQTIYAGHQPFNYNQRANRGVSLGFAPWIVVANNDLIFHDGWLFELLRVTYPLVSPKCPLDSRQAHITQNACGFNNIEHLSGWCFMISRQLWHRIGGFDEDVAFWCSDDAVVEQVKALGIAPMMVPSATVEHLRSQTLDRSPDYDRLTWGQVEIFNQKYHAEKMLDDPRYQEWLNSRNDKIEAI